MSWKGLTKSVVRVRPPQLPAPSRARPGRNTWLTRPARHRKRSSKSSTLYVPCATAGRQPLPPCACFREPQPDAQTRRDETCANRRAQGEITKDAIYIDAERRFTELEKETKKLHEESKK